MDMDLIKESCKQLEGLHDFRNLCKHDKITLNDGTKEERLNYFRHIYKFDIELVSENKFNS